jgi:hypothetical protein
MINVKWIKNSKNILIISDQLFHKGPRPLVTVSMAVITVLHSAEAVHFHYELCCPYAQVNYSQNTSKLSRQGNTMKSFTRQTDVELPFHMAQWRATYTHKDRGRTIPDSSSHSYAKKVTTNKLEKVLLYD